MSKRATLTAYQRRAEGQIGMFGNAKWEEMPNHERLKMIDGCIRAMIELRNKIIKTGVEP